MSEIIWFGTHNYIRAAMEESLLNALGISTFTRNMLYAARNNPETGFMLIYTETDLVYNAFLDAVGIKRGTGTSKEAYTDNVETLFKQMKPHLNHFETLTRNFFEIDTLEFSNIWGSSRNKFYNGSYEQRELSLKAVADKMLTYPNLVSASAEVLAWCDQLKSARVTQQGLIGGYKTNTSQVHNATEAMILQLYRALSWLNYFYALLPNHQENVNAFFDTNKIKFYKNKKIYVKHIPAGGFVKLCIHKSKSTDIFKVLVDGEEDVYLSSAINNTTPGTNTDFKATAGVLLEKKSTEVLTDLTKTHIIATNSSLTNSTHIIFEIIEE